MCCGLFIDGEDLGDIISAQEERIGPESVQGTGGAPAITAVEPVVYLRCPTCEKTMNRVNYGRCSGVIIDHCREHGFWLDSGELERIARFVASGGLLKTYRRQVEDAKAEERRQRSSTDPMAAQMRYDVWGKKEPDRAGEAGGLLGKLIDLLMG